MLMLICIWRQHVAPKEFYLHVIPLTRRLWISIQKAGLHGYFASVPHGYFGTGPRVWGHSDARGSSQLRWCLDFGTTFLCHTNPEKYLLTPSFPEPFIAWTEDIIVGFSLGAAVAFVSVESRGQPLTDIDSISGHGPGASRYPRTRWSCVSCVLQFMVPICSDITVWHQFHPFQSNWTILFS